MKPSRIKHKPFIRVGDFWQKVQPHSGYCIITVAIPKERVAEVPDLLRSTLRLPKFRAKASRMGKILRITDLQLAFYEYDRQVKKLVNWRETHRL